MTTTTTRNPWEKSRTLERRYAATLRKIAAEVGRLIDRFNLVEDPRLIQQMMEAAERYADTLTPWAQARASQVIASVDLQDIQAWRAASADLSAGLRHEILTAPTGETQRFLMAEQVELIRSLPQEAALRAQKLAVEAMVGGRRAEEVAQMLAETGQVTKSRANMIARTEIARASSTLTQARAMYVGATSYIWRTARDERVRQSHREMEGRVVEWANPPTLSDGTRTNAGQIYNCFTGSTKVSLANGCLHLWRTFYEGRLIVIELEGVTIETTPNHPILTQRGWVAAQDLNEIDNIVQCRQDDIRGLSDDVNDADATFEEIFGALSSVVRTKRHAGLLFDFHGDIPAEDVDAIRPDHLLPGYGDTTGIKRIRDLALARANGGVANGGVVSGEFHVGEPLVAGALKKFAPSLGTGPFHSNHHGLAAVAELNAMVMKHSGHGSALASDLSGEGFQTSAARILREDKILRKIEAVGSREAGAWDRHAARAQMTAERIGSDVDGLCGGTQTGAIGYKLSGPIKVGRRNFLGHVYTMETANRWFSVASGAAIVKNCRCYGEPIIPRFST